MERRNRKLASGIGECYFATIRWDCAEFRAVSETADRLEVTIDSGDPLVVTPVARERGYCFFRQWLFGLDPNASYEVEVRNGVQRTTLILETLPMPSGECRLRFGVLPDLHLQPRADRRALGDREKRLYPVVKELTAKYLKRLEAQGADMIFLPGDTLDPCDDETIKLLKRLFSSVSIPCHLLVGNHELYGRYNERDCYRAFGLPEHGCYTVTNNGVACIMLSTPDQACLCPGSPRYHWLTRELEALAGAHDILVFTHFSLLLHPCVQGWKNDGMQQLDDAEAVLALLERQSTVRGVIAGHKNVPSRMERNGIIHLLSPQLIQSPCGYSLIEIYPKAMAHNVYEIEEMHYLQRSRDALGAEDDERFGTGSDRHFVWEWRM